MQFRTEIILNPPEEKINYDSKLFFIGSCFSNNIGEKLYSGKIEVLINPFGVVFNPASIAEQISLITSTKTFSENDVFQHNDIFKSFILHSTFSKKNKNELVDSVNSEILNAHSYLKTASHVFITLGSAFTYKNISTNKIISNCHKLPQNNFEKILLGFSEVTNHIKNITENIRQVNPNAQIVFTVSPVKHIKDGIVNDNLSKSILVSSVNEFIIQEKKTSYFPAYELLNNDLRDYRFYSQDMAHPSEQAIEYIFDKFSEFYFSNETAKLFESVLQIQTAMLHKIMSDTENEKIKFANSMLQKIQELESGSTINMDAAKNHFSSLLHPIK